MEMPIGGHEFSTTVSAYVKNHFMIIVEHVYVCILSQNTYQYYISW